MELLFVVMVIMFHLLKWMQIVIVIVIVVVMPFWITMIYLLMNADCEDDCDAECKDDCADECEDDCKICKVQKLNLKTLASYHILS